MINWKLYFLQFEKEHLFSLLILLDHQAFSSLWLPWEAKKLIMFRVMEAILNIQQLIFNSFKNFSLFSFFQFALHNLLSISVFILNIAISMQCARVLMKRHSNFKLERENRHRKSSRACQTFEIIWILTYIHTNFYADNPTHKQVGCFLLIFHCS